MARSMEKDLATLGLTEKDIKNLLTERQQKVLHLYYEGNTFAEIGDAISVTGERARQILHKCGRILREQKPGQHCK